MSADPAPALPFACNCGELSGEITTKGVSSGTHVVCFCPDCRAGQLYFGQPDPAPGPVDIFQMSPEFIRITKGAENLAVMRLGPKGLFRWYAKCCNAPVATTTSSMKFPFAGFDVARFSDPSPLGPVKTRAHVQQANGKWKHENVAPAVLGMIRRVISARLSGRWKQNPFFDVATGDPVVAPHVISLEERKALYD
ncbi:DUF6151 family protein [Ruegeria arenilitoris]|uniref:DUF6151 family protein n=1 Tax=Ruegeria arenilitoris TaxID=1173585 RepID=UPI001C939B13|nr:DUF6151 family protein [Ruegeria arenilitoris]MBY6081707.1 hypothetical protein [Ruegeria arenilitoris]